GKLPPEYPLEPGERPQAPPPRRRTPPRGSLPEAARAARREVALQLQVVEAARRLAAAPGLAPEQRRRRQRLQAEAAQRLRQLRAQLGPAHDENGSLCDLPVLENGVLPAPKPPPVAPGRPSPPRAGPGSPDRRPPWVPDGRRSSLASPASPARTLPRSASSFEGRSVPATPVLARSPCARGHPLCRPEAPGLPPRPWSGSQDSQLGGPPAPAPPAQAPRTRRSNSSEALIDWGGGGGPPESAAPPQQPPPPTEAGGRGPPSAEQRRSQKWLALEGLRDWYLRHTGTPPAATPPRLLPPPPGPAWAPPRRRDPPPGLPHSLSYAGALAPRYGAPRGYRAPLF
ncbi:coiled-coil domain-containing protein 120, partial [Strigops habroptila]|uniref:Coiled-coil domain containing 120 n=1 Tax=Strigops habroptila TaxID=2489341 RepID=A0A672U3Y3_STRHB